MLTYTGLSAEHIGQLALLEQQCFSVPWSRQAFKQELVNPLAFYRLAWEDKVLLGYIGVWMVGDEGTVNNIAVLPSHRRQGIGKKLMGLAEEECTARKMRLLTLEVRERNAAAQALYTAMGYQPVGRRKGYYQKPVEDAILMTKYLKETTHE